MELKQLQEKTMAVSKRFSIQYDTRDNLIDLVEEVGELAQALQISTGRKYTNNPLKQRTREDVADALGDILFELIRIAASQGLDLEAEYLKVLDQITKRIDSGEFNKANT